MSIGATTGKEPDHVADGDLKSLEELRGAYKDMHKAKLSLNERASYQSVMTELSVVKQQMEMTHEQMRRLIGMYSTLSDEFNEYRSQRVRELNIRVNGGSTTSVDQDYLARSANGSTSPEDYDDHNN